MAGASAGAAAGHHASCNFRASALRLLLLLQEAPSLSILGKSMEDLVPGSKRSAKPMEYLFGQFKL